MRDALSVVLFLLVWMSRFTSASRWTIMVVTSKDIDHAGSAANVFANISGTLGHHTSLSLGKRHPKGGVQYFTVEMRIGVPYEVRVWHDNTGKGPAWHLDRMVLINHSKWQQFMFVCECWLAVKGSLTQTLPQQGHLYIPRKKSFPLKSSNHKLDITVDDIMGGAKVRANTDNSSGLMDTVHITIETENVCMGKFIIHVTPQTIPLDTCENTPSCLCYKRVQQNTTGASERKQLVDELKEELTVDKKKTSVNLRRYISAKDDRPSSQAIGSVGAVLLAIPVVLVVLSDLLNVFKAKKRRPRRVKYSLAETNHSPRRVPPPQYTMTDEFLADKE